MSFSNILEGARQYFQGLPTANNNNSNNNNNSTNNNNNNGTNNVQPQQATTQQQQQQQQQQSTQPQAAPQWPPHSTPGQPPPAPDLRWPTPKQQYPFPQYNNSQQYQEAFNNTSQKNNYVNHAKTPNNYQFTDKSKQLPNSTYYNHTSSRLQQTQYDPKTSQFDPSKSIPVTSQYDPKNLPTQYNPNKIVTNPSQYDLKNASVPTAQYDPKNIPLSNQYTAKHLGSTQYDPKNVPSTSQYDSKTISAQLDPKNIQAQFMVKNMQQANQYDPKNAPSAQYNNKISSGSHIDLKNIAATASQYDHKTIPVSASYFDAKAMAALFNAKNIPATSSHYDPKSIPATSSHYDAKNIPATSSHYDSKNIPATSSHYDPKNIPATLHYDPKSIPTTSSHYDPKNIPATSSHYDPKNIPTSSHYDPKNIPATSTHYDPKNIPTTSSHYDPKNIPVSSSHFNSKNMPPVSSSHYDPKNIPVTSQYDPKNIPASTAHFDAKNIPVTTAHFDPKNMPAASQYDPKSMQARHQYERRLLNQYPTIGGMDRAFAQHYNAKVNATSRSNESNSFSPRPLVNSFTTQQQQQQYAQSRANYPTKAYPNEQSKTYPSEMKGYPMDPAKSYSSEQKVNSTPSQSKQQFNSQKMHQYYPQQQQYASQPYPTMNNPTASWVAAMGQQYRPGQHFQQPQAARQHTGQAQQQQQSDLKSSLLKSAEQPNKNIPQIDLTAQLLQPPKAPAVNRQQGRPPGVRRDSPLDLSVRTIRRSADSTLDDERGTPDLTHASPDSTRLQQQDLSLHSLLRSNESALLPAFRPSFRNSTSGSAGDKTSSLLSLEQKFGARVTPAPESHGAPQYASSSRQQYLPQREGPHATPHLAAHALAQQQQASQFRPNSGHSAANKRVLSILRNSLEERSHQNRLLLAQNAAGMTPQQQHRVGRPPNMEHHMYRPHSNNNEQHRPLVEPVPATSVAPPQQGGELDGLAAFLAARIRTKAELKQCGDAQQSLQVTPPGGAPAPGSAHRPRRECPCGEDNCPGCPGQSMAAAAVTSRKVSETRSSTETSVFDFPDSDPEMSTPASVSDLRRNRKPPSIDVPQDCPGTSAPATPAAPPPPPLEEEDPFFAKVCSSFLTSLETKGARTSRAGQLAYARKRKAMQQAEEEAKKVIKTEEEIKKEPEVSKEEIELIESCLKVSSDCGKLLEALPVVTDPDKSAGNEPSCVKEEGVKKTPRKEKDSDSDILKKKPRKVAVESSSESDFEDTLSLAARQQQLLHVFSSTSESTAESSDDSDWSDDEGKALAGRLKKRTTRSRGRGGYGISTRLRSTRSKTPAKRPGRPRRKVKTPSSDSESEECPIPRRTRRQQRKSPSPASTKQKKSKSPIRKKSKSPPPVRQTRSKSPIVKKSKSKSPPPVIQTRSKSPIVKNSKSKSPPPVRQTRSKSPVVKKSKSKSPTPTPLHSKNPKSSPVPKKSNALPVTRLSRKRSKSPSTESRDPGFYPGWESELVKFKQSLRMPSNLIIVHSRPNSDPPTPTKKRRGYTNSPISCASDPGVSGSLRSRKIRDIDTSDSSNSTPLRKPRIRDVELSDSSSSLQFRPRRNESAKAFANRKELFDKLTEQIKSRGRKKKVEADKVVEEDKPKLRRGLRNRRRSSRLSGSLDRRLLRSAALQRSNRALMNSKRHLRQRDLRASETSLVKPGAKRGPKGRRKLRSSGFDYLRKKKKKREFPESKRTIGVSGMRQSACTVEDLANEMKSWVVNKGLGETVLHRAARMSYNDMVAYCLELLNMDPSVRDNAGYTPLHEACARGHLSTARLLLLYGARVDGRAQGGIRPLHEAADFGHVELMRLLLSYGADPLLPTYLGQTPLNLASSPETRKMLEGHMADVQGRPASSWNFAQHWTSEYNEICGFDVLAEPPELTDLVEKDFEFEEVASEQELKRPASWWLPGETEPMMILAEVCASLGHTTDWIRKGLRAELSTREIPREQFFQTARPVHLLASDWKHVLTTSDKNIVVIHSDDKLCSLLAKTKPR